jgi:hypothetical protein
MEIRKYPKHNYKALNDLTNKKLSQMYKSNSSAEKLEEKLNMKSILSDITWCAQMEQKSLLLCSSIIACTT